jgi:hypothetical protein
LYWAESMDIKSKQDCISRYFNYHITINFNTMEKRLNWVSEVMYSTDSDDEFEFENEVELDE